MNPFFYQITRKASDLRTCLHKLKSTQQGL